jgi:hypothetical protein
MPLLSCGKPTGITMLAPRAQSRLDAFTPCERNHLMASSLSKASSRPGHTNPNRAPGASMNRAGYSTSLAEWMWLPAKELPSDNLRSVPRDRSRPRRSPEASSGGNLATAAPPCGVRSGCQCSASMQAKSSAAPSIRQQSQSNMRTSSPPSRGSEEVPIVSGKTASVDRWTCIDPGIALLTWASGLHEAEAALICPGSPTELHLVACSLVAPAVIR